MLHEETSQRGGEASSTPPPAQATNVRPVYESGQSPPTASWRDRTASEALDEPAGGSGDAYEAPLLGKALDGVPTTRHSESASGTQRILAQPLAPPIAGASAASPYTASVECDAEMNLTPRPLIRTELDVAIRSASDPSHHLAGEGCCCCCCPPAAAGLRYRYG